ncbi:hypothetical protein C8E89_106171 [Mycolicibacterium moriokaense]|uniref:Uncharacterized protein n=1 Tax=Mycolicibacterium moriokaense TaxID=39691 RepID=A0A318HHJ5_9MYCO|nr:hypothetical protein C8E89_106171 [Mycolicibacterium moriokaense]
MTASQSPTQAWSNALRTMNGQFKRKSLAFGSDLWAMSYWLRVA